MSVERFVLVDNNAGSYSHLYVILPYDKGFFSMGKTF